MRKFVAYTAIMLSVTLLLTGGKVTVSSAYATQKTPAPAALVKAPALCSKNYKGLLVAPHAPETKSLEDIMITQKVTGETPIVPEVLAVEPTPVVESVVAVASLPLPEASPSAEPSPALFVPSANVSANISSTLDAEKLFSLVNQTRIQAGLPPFEKHPDVCAITQSRAPELDNEIYGTSSMHAGFRARHLPFRASENMISQKTEEAALSWWMNSPIHRSAIMGNTKYACVSCQGQSCGMVFSNLDSTTATY